MKKCPYCDQEIQDEAVKCRFCAEMLVRDQKPPLSVEDAAFPNLIPGYIIAGIFGALELMPFLVHFGPRLAAVFTLVFVALGLAGFVYWAVCLYKLHQSLRVMSDNCYPITPGKAVGFGFIPFFNLYWIFKWPAEILNFIKLRSAEVKTWKASVPGYLLLLSFAARRIDGVVWFLMAFGVLSYLIQVLKKSLAVSPVPTPYKSSMPDSPGIAVVLCCLLIVPLIGLLAAIAIPNLLRARINANEKSVAIELRKIAAFTENFRKSQNPQAYPPHIEALVAGTDLAWLSEKQSYHGYRYIFASQPATFSILAVPVEPNKAAINTYCIDQNNILYTSAKSTQPVKAEASGCSGGLLAN